MNQVITPRRQLITFLSLDTTTPDQARQAQKQLRALMTEQTMRRLRNDIAEGAGVSL